MFKILTYADSQNIYSSRKIETACRRDIKFMWLLAGQPLNHEYIQVFLVGPETRTQDLQKISRFPEERCRKDGTVFVHGCGKRKSKNQRYFELFRRFLERQTVYDRHTAGFQSRNNYCKTDPNAAFMHMKEDHMRNAQLKPGYKVQISVDSEYIVAADIFRDRNDVWTLVPFLKTMEKNLGFRYPSVTADSGITGKKINFKVGYLKSSTEGTTTSIELPTTGHWYKIRYYECWMLQYKGRQNKYKYLGDTIDYVKSKN